MKKEVAKKRITNAINKEYANETQLVRNYLIDLVFLTFQNLETDYDACHDDGTPYTSTENLKYALTTIDDYALDEARRETSK